MTDESLHNRILVGTRVRELRKAQGLSQRRLADMVAMDHSYICKLESGKENPTVDMLTRLANGLEVRIVQLFESGSEKDYAIITSI